MASSLIESLDPVADKDVEAAWQEEIARRLDNLRSGKAKPVPWAKVRSKARAVLHDEAAR